MWRDQTHMKVLRVFDSDNRLNKSHHLAARLRSISTLWIYEVDKFDSNKQTHFSSCYQKHFKL